MDREKEQDFFLRVTQKGEGSPLTVVGIPGGQFRAFNYTVRVFSERPKEGA